MEPSSEKDKGLRPECPFRLTRLEKPALDRLGNAVVVIVGHHGIRSVHRLRGGIAHGHGKSCDLKRLEVIVAVAHHEGLGKAQTKMVAEQLESMALVTPRGVTSIEADSPAASCTGSSSSTRCVRSQEARST